MKEQLYSVIYEGVLVNEVDNKIVSVSKAKPFEDTLEYLQNLVGGYIEHFVIDEELNNQHIDMWINEDGKMQKLKPTFALEYDGKLIDIIVGNCVFTKYDDEGNTLGLTIQETQIVSNWLASLPVGTLIDKNGKSVHVLVVGRGVAPQHCSGEPTDTETIIH